MNHSHSRQFLTVCTLHGNISFGCTSAVAVGLSCFLYILPTNKFNSNSASESLSGIQNSLQLSNAVPKSTLVLEKLNQVELFRWWKKIIFKTESLSLTKSGAFTLEAIISWLKLNERLQNPQNQRWDGSAWWLLSQAQIDLLNWTKQSEPANN